MCVLDRIADGDESIQQPSQLEFERSLVGCPMLMQIVDRLAQTLSLNHPHGVVRSTVGMVSETVDGHNSRVLEPSSDFRFAQKPIAAIVIVDEAWLNLFECNQAIELCVARDKDAADTSLRVQIQ
jgi:hypothetical protein